MNDPAGIVFDVQRSAMHDGPGIRTTVFLKGCPLRCAWCHNPESQNLAPETGRSGRIYGREMRVSEVMAIVRRDKPFYAASGGGMTVSGGEPTQQYEFCAALLAAARAESLHTCLDTCGGVDWPRLEQLMPHVSLFLYDYKATAPEEHRALTGVDNRLIQENLRRLLAAGAAVRLRCPLLPDVNATPAHLAAIAALGREFPALAIDLMPYHATGESKYDDLDQTRPVLPTHIPTAEEITAWAEALRAAGAQTVATGGA